MSVAIDWLSFTFFPGDSWREEVQHFLRANFGLSGWDVRNGWQGYECSARVDGALVAWGGEAQRGSVHVELPGTVCGQCDDWPTVVEWLHLFAAKLTRVDIAGDDFESSVMSVAWGLEQYAAGNYSLFGARGNKPKARLISDVEGKAGDTLYIGNRANGKLLRLYEKGKQLGDSAAKWVRAEVEWRAKDRVLSYDMLVRPAVYLAGAFPCLSFFSDVVATVRAFKARAVLSFAKMVAVARSHAGKAINAILTVSGGDMGQCVDLLRRSGFPQRLDRAEVSCLTGT